MAQPTLSNLFDNETTLINSAAYDSGTTTLTIVFSQDVLPIQAFAAIAQSAHNWLLENTDQTVNANATPGTINSTTRDGQVKEQTTLTFQFFTPLPDVTFDPTLL
ncbi:MAG: hypothetical protein F6K62_16780 [Sphaerospermopsis sp. SIO1G2]|nr:hypothetical protein [Sphaerospermopsis sp. SIO1G2]